MQRHGFEPELTSFASGCALTSAVQGIVSSSDRWIRAVLGLMRNHWSAGAARPVGRPADAALRARGRTGQGHRTAGDLCRRWSCRFLTTVGAGSPLSRAARLANVTSLLRDLATHGSVTEDRRRRQDHHSAGHPGHARILTLTARSLATATAFQLRTGAQPFSHTRYSAPYLLVARPLPGPAWSR
jgi:hypothetical protein